MYIKSRCSFSAAEITMDGKPYRSCSQWNTNVMAELTWPSKPDVVLTSSGRSTALPDGTDAGGRTSFEAMAAGMRQQWSALEEAGVGGVVLEDTPQLGRNVYECVSENAEHLTRCTSDQADADGSGGALAQRTAAAQYDRVAYIDLNDAICPTAKCAPVIGNVLVYRQGWHLIATNVETLAPRLGTAIEQALTGAR